MDAETIEMLLKNNCLTEDIFKGVFPSNKIPKIKAKSKTKQGFVFNLDPSYKDGSHWISIIITPENEKNIYFDSYGWPPVISGFKKLMRNDYVYNKHKMQSDYSTACGQWCLYFLLNQALDVSLDSLVSLLKNQDTLRNDHYINHMINIFFNSDLKVLDKKFLTSQIAKSLKTDPSADALKSGLLEEK